MWQPYSSEEGVILELVTTSTYDAHIADTDKAVNQLRFTSPPESYTNHVDIGETQSERDHIFISATVFEKKEESFAPVI